MRRAVRPPSEVRRLERGAELEILQAGSEPSCLGLGRGEGAMRGSAQLGGFSQTRPPSLGRVVLLGREIENQV